MALKEYKPGTISRARSAISSLYQPPFAFTGRIFKVTVDVTGRMIQDTEEEAKAHAKAAMARH
jgi:hypothetical protein